MKKITLFLYLPLYLIFMFSCQAQENKINEHFSDETFFKVDTTYKSVDINNIKYNIAIQRDKFDDNLKPYENIDSLGMDNPILFSPVTIVFRNLDNKVQLVKKYDYYPLYVFKGITKNLSNPGKLYLKRFISAGGSGYTEPYYLVIKENEEIVVKEIFEIGTLDFISFNKNDKEVLVLYGIWNSSSETHFDDHKQRLVKYTFDSNNSFTERELGTTKFKYGSINKEKSIRDVLFEIKRREPYLLKNIFLEDYIF